MKRSIVVGFREEPLREMLLKDTCALASYLPYVESAVCSKEFQHLMEMQTSRQRWMIRGDLPSLLRPHFDDNLRVWNLDLCSRHACSTIEWQIESKATRIAARLGGVLNFTALDHGLRTLVTMDCELPTSSPALRAIFGALIENHWRALISAAELRLRENRLREASL